VAKGGVVVPKHPLLSWATGADLVPVSFPRGVFVGDGVPARLAGATTKELGCSLPLPPPLAVRTELCDAATVEGGRWTVGLLLRGDAEDDVQAARPLREVTCVLRVGELQGTLATMCRCVDGTATLDFGDATRLIGTFADTFGRCETEDAEVPDCGDATRLLCVVPDEDPIVCLEITLASVLCSDMEDGLMLFFGEAIL